jgi:sugar phosphate permease
MKNTKTLAVSYFMWFLPTLFFAFQFILRLWPGLMMESIMQQFAISASVFGFLASVYYWGYASMQIPIAIMLDRFGTKYILFASASVCGIATALFAMTDNLYVAILSRFLIGMGSAAGFLTTSKIISLWFPKQSYSTMVGFSFMLGLVGAVYGGKPIHNLVEAYSYIEVSIFLGVVSIMIGAVALFALKQDKHNISISHMSHSVNDIDSSDNVIKLQDLLSILTSPAICLLAVANLLMVGSLEGFADVWGVNYLISAYNIGKGEAAGVTSFIFIGMIFGGPILAYCGSYLGNLKTIMFCGVGMTILFCCIVYFGLSYNTYIFSTLFLLMGVLCCYQVLVFSVGNDLVSAKFLGITVAFLNCINMLGGSFFHTIIGNLMDMFWTGAHGEDGLSRIYEVANYSYALCVIPICSFLGTVLVFYIGKKYRH